MSPSAPHLITFVSNNSWSVYNFRLAIIKLLQQQGFTILVIAPKDNFSDLLEKEGCLFEPVVFNNRSASPLADLRYYRELKSLYKQYRPALIFHFVAKPNIYGSMAAGVLKIPSIAVITGLGYAFDRQNWLRSLVKKLYKKALKSALEVWFLNAEDAAVFAREKITQTYKIKVLPGEGIDTGFFRRPAENLNQKIAGTDRKFTTVPPVFIFLMSCRLLKTKGIALYAEAAEQLKPQFPEMQCWLIGDFENRHPDNLDPVVLQKWLQAGLIQYYGFVHDVRPYLLQADCALLPSYYHEGIPRSLMEAASMELPLITTNSQGCRELLVENESGFLCRIKDAADLTAKMKSMMLLPKEERFEMGEKGRSLMVQKFDISLVLRFYLEAIDAYSKKNAGV